MTESFVPRWYVAQTHPHAERKAALHLVRQGFVTYLPQYLKRRRHARRVEIVPSPVFPGYLFIGIDLAKQRWRSIRSTIGVARLVCNGEEPAVVPDRIVAELKGREDERGFIRLETKPHFSPGDRVRLLQGAFSSCLGLFEGVTDNERVTILLELLGRKVRVHVEAELVSAA